MQDTDQDADHDMTWRLSLLSGTSLGIFCSFTCGQLPNTEHRTTNFHGAAGNLRLDFETNFFSDPKFFELEIFWSTTSRGWIGSGGMTVRCSVFGVRCLEFHVAHLREQCGYHDMCNCSEAFASHLYLSPNVQEGHR